MSVIFRIKAKTSTKSLSLIQDFNFQMLDGCQEIENFFKNPLNSKNLHQVIYPESFFEKIWNQKQEVSTLQSDYQDDLYQINNSKTIHLISPFSIKLYPNCLTNLISSIKICQHAGASKIVLHLLSSTDLELTTKIFCGQEIVTTSSQNKQLVLGSLGDSQYFLNNQDLNQVGLGLRPMFDIAATTNLKKAQTLDDYLKLVHDIHYWENFSIYSEKDLLELENTTSLSAQISQIQKKNKENKIFPVGLNQSGIKPDDLVWILNSKDLDLSQSLNLLQLTNQDLDLNLSILTTTNSNLNGETLLQDPAKFSPNSEQKHYPILFFPTYMEIEKFYKKFKTHTFNLINLKKVTQTLDNLKLEKDFLFEINVEKDIGEEKWLLERFKLFFEFKNVPGYILLDTPELTLGKAFNLETDKLVVEKIFWQSEIFEKIKTEFDFKQVLDPQNPLNLDYSKQLSEETLVAFLLK